MAANVLSSEISTRNKNRLMITDRKMCVLTEVVLWVVLCIWPINNRVYHSEEKFYKPLRLIGLLP